MALSMVGRALSVVFATALVFAAPNAFACAVCATADPTLTASGEEQPFRNRLRIFADARFGRVDAANIAVDDRRIEIGATWAPTRALELTFAAPYLVRTITSGEHAFDHATAGDVELRARLLAYESRGSFGIRRFGLLGGLKFPTAPIERDESGIPLASVLQPGCSSIAPTLGAYYATSHGKWSEYASVSLFLPFSVRDGPHAGDSARLAAHVQFQPSAHAAGRIGVFGRLDASGQLAQGVDDPNSGGFIGYLTGDLVVSPVDDLVITGGVFFPIIEAFRGTHHESAIVALTVAYDF